MIILILNMEFKFECITFICIRSVMYESIFSNLFTIQNFLVFILFFLFKLNFKHVPTHSFLSHLFYIFRLVLFY